jgi:hypothetical protein
MKVDFSSEAAHYLLYNYYIIIIISEGEKAKRVFVINDANASFMMKTKEGG